MTIELTEDERTLLTLALGMATGLVAAQPRSNIMPYLRLANAVHRGNPNWTPYVVEEETSR